MQPRYVNGIPVNIHLDSEAYQKYESVFAPTTIDRGSLMTATDIVDVIPSGGDFRIDVSGLDVNVPAVSGQFAPETVAFTAQWFDADEKEARTGKDANTFGRSGTLEVDHPPAMIRIPMQDARCVLNDALASFGAKLVPANQPMIGFNTSPYPLAVVTYKVQADYTQKYLFQSDGGGGAFLEHHVPPHVWVPMNPACRGALILGKQHKNQFELTAVSIPFGYMLALDANALHADCFLVGDYAMALSATQDKAADASTVIFRKPSSEIQPVEIVAASHARFFKSPQAASSVVEATAYRIK